MEVSQHVLLRSLFLGMVQVFVLIALLRRARWAPAWLVSQDVDDPRLHRCRWVDAALLALLLVMVGLSYLGGGEPPAVAPPAQTAPAGGISVPMVAATAMLQILGAVFLVLYLRLVRGVNPVAALGLGTLSIGKVIKWGLVTAVVGFVAAQGVTWAVYQVLLGQPQPQETDQQVVQTFKHAGQGTLRMALFVLCSMVVPLSEELLYRGFIFGIAKYFAGRWPAIIFSSAIFALAHENAMAALPLFVLGVGFALSYERSRCLWVPVVAHSVFNSWNLLALALGAGQ
jgi:membrane protease YdiL (CAAX protease family)